MDISLGYLSQIAKSLPISYYTNRKVGVTISETEDGSYYNPTEDTFVISLPQVQKAFQPLSDNISDAEKESLVRSVYYHEVSHAVLTPNYADKNLQDYFMGGKGVTPAFNIFEDERIETILHDFYANTDFDRMKYLVNGYTCNADIPTPQTAEQAFYNICRFHIGKEEFVKRFWDIFKDYAHLTADITDYSNMIDAYHYYVAIEEFFEDVKKDFKQNGGGSGNENSGSGNGFNGDIKASENTSNDSAEIPQEVKDLIAEMVGRGGGGSETPFTKMVGHFDNSTVFKSFDSILAEFSKKNNGGSSIGAYSGVLNPRRIGRDTDYRFFDRHSTVQGTNSFGSCHLNLFIDCSGSFNSNNTIVNQMLCALAKLEKKYPFFTFDLVRCSIGQEIADKKDRTINAIGGNRLTADIVEQYRTLQNPNTLNYNIVLFDGWCSPVNKKYFKTFDKSNCTVISDSDNKSLCVDFTHTKPIITRRYSDELLAHITKALRKAFR